MQRTWTVIAATALSTLALVGCGNDNQAAEAPAADPPTKTAPSIRQNLEAHAATQSAQGHHYDAWKTVSGQNSDLALETTYAQAALTEKTAEISATLEAKEFAAAQKLVDTTKADFEHLTLQGSDVLDTLAGTIKRDSAKHRAAIATKKRAAAAKKQRAAAAKKRKAAAAKRKKDEARRATAESSCSALPSMAGMNHQDAQDLLRGNGFFRLKEVDATGNGRKLIWDRNWVVVSQHPSPGTCVGAFTKITLASKKIGE